MHNLLRPATVAAIPASLPLGAQAAEMKTTPDLEKVVAAAKAEKVMDVSSAPGVNGGAEMAQRIADSIKKYFGIDVVHKFTPGGPMGEMGNKLVTEFRASHRASTDL